MLKHNQPNKLSLTILGTGTSQGIPVIGCNCEVCTSPNPKDKRLRTSAVFSFNNTNIGIDVGPDFRQQMLRAKINNLSAVLITHEHNDHIIGLDDVRPFNFLSGKNMPIFALPRVAQNIQDRFKYIFEKDPYPGAPRLTLNSINANEPFQIEGITVTPIKVMHGQLPIVGYQIQDIVYLTDVKTLSEATQEKIKNARILVLNALHHSKHHSHLNLEEALALIHKVTPQKAYLTHISHRMGKHEEINLQLPENVELAFDELVIS